VRICVCVCVCVCVCIGCANDLASCVGGEVVTVVLQWCYSGVTVVLQWCYSGVTVVSKRYYSGVSVVLQLRYSGVTDLASGFVGDFVLLSRRCVGGPRCGLGRAETRTVTAVGHREKSVTIV
jgi:hypothetical protein